MRPGIFLRGSIPLFSRQTSFAQRPNPFFRRHRVLTRSPSLPLEWDQKQTGSPPRRTQPSIVEQKRQTTITRKKTTTDTFKFFLCRFWVFFVFFLFFLVFFGSFFRGCLSSEDGSLAWCPPFFPNRPPNSRALCVSTTLPFFGTVVVRRRPFPGLDLIVFI